MSGLFLTGTDTACGKTSVGCALARSVRVRGLRVRVLKPVETGCALHDGELVPADAVSLARAAADPSPLESLCPYRLALPAAPQVAAAEAGVTIDPERIASAYARAQEQADWVLVEGAGGLLVPLTPGFDMADLAKRLGLPLLLVARAALGTLNHTLLTLEAAAARQLPVIGVIFSETAPGLSSAERQNLCALRKRLPVPDLGELPYGAKAVVPELDPLTLLDPSGQR